MFLGDTKTRLRAKISSPVRENQEAGEDEEDEEDTQSMIYPKVTKPIQDHFFFPTVRVFYGQVIRFQRLTSDRIDFEVRTRSLANILIARGYNKDRLRNQFCKAIDKYMIQFCKWDIPSDLQLWFNQILAELSS